MASTRNVFRFLVACVTIASILPTVACAQAYPVRPVRFIVPTTPAGPNDVLTRLIAERLSERLGQQVIVDNRPGASGRIGLSLAAKGDIDGYTIFLGSQAQLAVHPANKQVKAIAIAAPRRSALLPDVPTFQESGMREFDGSAWWAVMTRRGVPLSVITRLNGEINAIVSRPDVQKSLAALDVEVSTSSPAEVVAYLKAERTKWSAVVKDAGITVD